LFDLLLLDTKFYIMRLFYWITALFILIGQTAHSQIHQPVKWSFGSQHVADDVFELQFEATIEDGWHLYSQHIDGVGPVPTEFTFEDNKDIKILGKVKEPKAEVAYDPNFDLEIGWFEKSVTFTQKVKILSEAVTVTGDVYFMVCDDAKCLPPEAIDFSINLKKVLGTAENNASATGLNTEESINNNAETSALKGDEESGIFNPVTWDFSAKKIEGNTFEIIAKASIDEGWHLYSQHLDNIDGPVATEFTFNNEADEFELIEGTKEEGDLHTEYDKNFMMELSFFGNEATFTQKIKAKDGVAKVSGDVYFMVCDDVKCLPPEAVEFTIDLPGVKAATEASATPAPTKKNSTTDRSFWEIFIISFLSGFAALLTPCVFPMIPMTVSFFTKQSKTKAEGIRNAILYGLSIIVIYVLLGTAVTAIFGSEALNQLATNVWFNLIFFVLLVVFAISFLGAFEIVLPSSWINAADKGANKGGLIGIFFMAFTLALVSFSCTGPIVGTLIVEAAAKGGIMPIVGMFGFSLAIALPFALFAAFPGWLNSLPQSGGWLNSVKVVLGFLELGLAIKFLSNADLVLQAGYITREVFIAFWIVIAIMLGMYLLGKIRLPHDSPIEKLSVGRTLLAVVVFTFAVYLIPGMWGAPLKLIAGFPPPMNYAEAPGGAFTSSGGGGHTEFVEGTHAGPQNLPVFHDLDKGIAYAKSVDKPVFVDFTGHACANCRKMEQNVWSEPEILEMLTNDVVIVSLYVDDRADLPQEMQREVTIGDRKKKIKTIGDKWMFYQVEKYKTNTQPYYVMLGPNGEDLSNGSADYEHHSNPDDFSQWLSEGLKLYQVAK